MNGVSINSEFVCLTDLRDGQASAGPAFPLVAAEEHGRGGEGALCLAFPSKSRRVMELARWRLSALQHRTLGRPENRARKRAVPFLDADIVLHDFQRHQQAPGGLSCSMTLDDLFCPFLGSLC